MVGLGFPRVQDICAISQTEADHDEVFCDGCSVLDHGRLPLIARLHDIPNIAVALFLAERRESWGYSVESKGSVGTGAGIVGCRLGLACCDVLIGHDALEDPIGGLWLVVWH